MRKNSLRPCRVLLALLSGAALAGGVALATLFAVTRADPAPAKQAREEIDTRSSVVADVTGLYRIPVQKIIVPRSVEDIITAVRAYPHLSIGGGRNSMGGQTASPRAAQLDMRQFNRVLAFSAADREITVQAGATWYDVQRYIDPHGLAVKTMQTYANFTVGGSLSVNAHGRYLGGGPIIHTVRSFRIVLADGSLVEASRASHSDIFHGAIGGYGGLGVIVDATLELADNVAVERRRRVLPVTQYRQYFFGTVRPDPDVVFHNGDIYPPAFDSVSAVSWSRTDRQPTVSDRLVPRGTDYQRQRAAMVVVSEWPLGTRIREHLLEPWFYASPAVHTRNYEASHDILELEPASRADSTYVLQEYFIPVERFDEWIPKMKRVFTNHHVNVVNVSIRHALPDRDSLLAWAPSETFAFVVYYKQGTDAASTQKVATWTREMIDAALSLGGRYYLPYQPWATAEQIHQAYPGLGAWFRLKLSLDPAGKFTNNLWDTYYARPAERTMAVLR